MDNCETKNIMRRGIIQNFVQKRFELRSIIATRHYNTVFEESPEGHFKLQVGHFLILHVKFEEDKTTDNVFL